MNSSRGFLEVMSSVRRGYSRSRVSIRARILFLFFLILPEAWDIFEFLK